MSNKAPELIAIEHDNHHATHIGQTEDGRQFFLTTPFEPMKNDFIALYLFDQNGRLLDAQIDDLGQRDQVNDTSAKQLFEQRLKSLGEIEYCRIEVQPFVIERFGTTFGLVPLPPEDEDEIWWVTAEPGDYMAFCEPWDSGEYDT